VVLVVPGAGGEGPINRGGEIGANGSSDLLPFLAASPLALFFRQVLIDIHLSPFISRQFMPRHIFYCTTAVPFYFASVFSHTFLNWECFSW
jgi:hypothetical protein